MRWPGPYPLEACALEWLRYRKQCILVMLERGPSREWTPDVYGVLESGWSIEVEVKRTRDDFRVNAQKPCWWSREWQRQRVANGQELPPGFYAPRWFYFMAPPEIAQMMMSELAPGAGLLTIAAEKRQTVAGLPPVAVLKAGRALETGTRLDAAEIRRLSLHVSGTVVSLAAALATARSNNNDAL